MLEKMKHIVVNDVEYPIIFTFNVIEAIENEKDQDYSVFLGSLTKDAKIGDFIWLMQQMVNEGIDIENEEKEENRPFVSHKQVGRILTFMGQDKLKESVFGAVTSAFDTGEKTEEKN